MEALRIRAYADADESRVVVLWDRCGLLAPQNDPVRDIARKTRVNPEWFFVGEWNAQLVATCMAGYEGHRGWLNYLAVDPDFRRKGLARRIVEHAEARLREAGCPKINLQVRATNPDAIAFYERIGYSVDPVVSLGKRLEIDS